MDYTLKIFNGPMPFSKEDEDCGMLLVEMSIERGPGGKNFKAVGVAVEDGVAGYYRVYADGRVFDQGEISEIDSEIKSNMTLAVKVISKGQQITIN